MQSALIQALKDVANVLDARSISYALIGGLAVVMRGEPRFTDDIDAVVALYPDEAVALYRSLVNSPFKAPFEDVEDVIARGLILPLQHIATGIIADLALGLTPFEAERLEIDLCEDLPARLEALRAELTDNE